MKPPEVGHHILQRVRLAPPPPASTTVGTTDQGNGKGRSGVRPMGTVAYGGKGQGKGKGRGQGRLGQGGRGRSQGGVGPMGTTADGGKGSKGRAANGDRPVGTASCRRDHYTMASCQIPLQARKKVEVDGEVLTGTTFIIPYPPGFPIIMPGQIISVDILDYMQKLDVTEIHGYNPVQGVC